MCIKCRDGWLQLINCRLDIVTNAGSRSGNDCPSLKDRLTTRTPLKQVAKRLRFVAYNLGDVSGPTGRLPARECCEQMIAESLIAKQAAKHHQPACTNALHRLQPFYTAQHPYHSPTQRLHGARRAVTPRRRHSAPQCSRIARWLAWIAQMIATMTTIISPSTATAYRRDGWQRMRAPC